MQYDTDQQPILKSPTVRITVKSAASKFLAKKLNPERDTLLFIWGTAGFPEKPGWQVSMCAMEDLPEETLQSSLVTKLRKIPLVIPQHQRAIDLDGKTLRCRRGALALE